MGLLSAIGTSYNEEAAASLISFFPTPKVPGHSLLWVMLL